MTNTLSVKLGGTQFSIHGFGAERWGTVIDFLSNLADVETEETCYGICEDCLHALHDESTVPSSASSCVSDADTETREPTDDEVEKKSSISE